MAKAAVYGSLSKRSRPTLEWFVLYEKDGEVHETTALSWGLLDRELLAFQLGVSVDAVVYAPLSSSR